MTEKKFPPIYSKPCSIVKKELDRLCYQLSDDIMATETWESGGRYVPQENWEEAKRRLRFVKRMLEKYHREFHSQVPLKGFIRNLKLKEERLEAELLQVSMFPVDDEGKKQEIGEIEEFKTVFKNFPRYIDDMYYFQKG